MSRAGFTAGASTRGSALSFAWAAAMAAAATCMQGSAFPSQSHDHSPPSTYSVTVGATACPGARTRSVSSPLADAASVTAFSRASLTPWVQTPGRLAFRIVSRSRCIFGRPPGGSSVRV